MIKTTMQVCALVGALTLSGCVEEKPENPPAKTVSYYMANSAEREAKLIWCRDDVTRAATPECQNAKMARTRSMVGTGKGTLDSLNFENRNKQ